MSRRRSRRPRGMALVMVLGAIALIAIVAARFAQRIDELRRQTGSLKEHAQASLDARSALAATAYYTATRPIGPAGFGPPLTPALRADGRAYSLPGGAEVRVQDERGLFPLNAALRQELASLLVALGVAPGDTDSYVDVLEDYLDTDSLKRLSGAEAQDYGATGLPPPRNDWLVTVRELSRMPRWRDNASLVAAMERWASPARQPVLNPNTAPIELLAARWPWAQTEQLEILRTLRHSMPFQDGVQAQRATGLPLARDEYVFHVGPRLRITTSGPGSPRAHQYNLMLTPGGRESPWHISDIQAVPRAESRDSIDRADPFPLALDEARKP